MPQVGDSETLHNKNGNQLIPIAIGLRVYMKMTVRIVRIVQVDVISGIMPDDIVGRSGRPIFE